MGLKQSAHDPWKLSMRENKLSDNSKYFWKVRIWDRKGKPSSWSEIQSFRTGVLLKIMELPGTDSLKL